MGIINRLRNVSKVTCYKMITERGNGYYAWDGKLYQSDIVRACIKPQVKAIGKLTAKHIRTRTLVDGSKKTEINPEPYIRFLLEEPNQFMTGQMLWEKAANQLALNNNAFILIERDSFGYPCGLYPIPCVSVEALYSEFELALKFTLQNGRIISVPYTDIIHLRDDYNENDIFGESPARALSSMMNIVNTADQGIVRAIKNSGIIRWLLKSNTAQRPEDVKRAVQDFVNNYLSVESETFGAAGIDSKIDVQRIEPKDYVPNALQTDRMVKRIQQFFGTNDKIIQSSYTEDEWIAYYEMRIEPYAQQFSEEFTRKLFTRKERGFGNKIIFEGSGLTFASMSTKLNLVTFVDRGIMTPNEVRNYLNLAPIDGGDQALLRKDTGTLKGGELVED